MDGEKTYSQNQRVLRVYSEFDCEDTGKSCCYRSEELNRQFVNEYKFTSSFVFDKLDKNVSALCRFIRVLCVSADEKRIVQNPFDYTGIQLMQMCLRKRSLNCAGCAVVLNDILISLGYKSKCIGCIPYSADRKDTHVVVHVYDDVKNLWFVADPAFGRVPCTESGECMDILALRSYLSEHDTLPFYQSGKIITENRVCRKYAEALVDKLVMFFVFQNSGLQHSMWESVLVVPEGINKISKLYNMAQKTNNAFWLFN